MLYALRCKIGIALKLAGCALIHGPGHHCWGGPVMERYGRAMTSCTSCGKYRDLNEPVVDSASLRVWRRAEATWGAVAEPAIVRAGRLGCRVLDRHHYLACRGRSDHGTRLVDGYPAPARR